MLHYAVTSNIIGSSRQVAISQSDFEEAERSYHLLQLAVAAEERFDTIARNFIDFESSMLESVLETSLVGFGAGMEQMGVRRLLNRRMSNFLSATRAYIDHLRHSAKELFDQDYRSDEVLASFAYHYDQTLGYRVLEALRNYSQHCGLPIHSVRYSTKVLHEKAGAPMKRTISPMLDVGRLKSDGQFKASVLKEIETHGQQINLKSLTREYIACLAEVHELFRGHVALVSKSANESLERLSQLSVDGSRVELYAVALNGHLWTRRVPLFSGLWEYGEFLSATNMHFAHAGFSYVSGEPEDDA